MGQPHLLPLEPNTATRPLVPYASSPRYHPYATSPCSPSITSDMEIDLSGRSLAGDLERDPPPVLEIPRPSSQSSRYHQRLSHLPDSTSPWPAIGPEDPMPRCSAYKPSSQSLPPHTPFSPQLPSPSYLPGLTSPCPVISPKHSSLSGDSESSQLLHEFPVPAPRTPWPRHRLFPSESSLPDVATTSPDPENKAQDHLPENSEQELFLQLPGPRPPSSRHHPFEFPSQLPTLAFPSDHKSQPLTQTSSNKQPSQFPLTPRGLGLYSLDRPALVSAIPCLDFSPKIQSPSPSLRSVSGSDLADTFQIEQQTPWPAHPQLGTRCSQHSPPIVPFTPHRQASQGQEPNDREVVVPCGSIVRFLCRSGGDWCFIIGPSCGARQVCGPPYHTTNPLASSNYTPNFFMPRRSAGQDQSNSNMDSGLVNAESTVRVTRSSKAAPEKRTQPLTTGKILKQSGVRTTAGSNAKQASQGSALSKKKNPPPGPKAKDALNPARGAPKNANSKKAQPRAIPVHLNVDLGEDDGGDDDGDDDGDIVMTGTPASNGRAKGNGGQLPRTQPRAALKRKSSARSISGTTSAIEDPQSDDSTSLQAPQPKKTRPAKQVGGRNGPRPVSSRSPASTALNSPAIVPQALPTGPNKSSKGRKGPAEPKSAVATAQNVVLTSENVGLKALLAAAQAEIQRLQEANTQTQQELTSNKQLIPRPPGERGKNGWNLQANMGLKNNYNLYSNIRRCVRYAVYEAQLNIWKKITQQDERALFTCYGVVKQRFPYMAQFEGNWATREFIKGICQNARRHCRKKGISDPTLPAELLEELDGGGNDDGDNDGGHGDGNDDDNEIGRISTIQTKASRSSAKLRKGNGPHRKASEESEAEFEDDEEVEYGEDGENGENGEDGEDGEDNEDLCVEPWDGVEDMEDD
ncbi:hypothetical protein M407DRAFT_34066 [Tulasnella calospora MUT 4182]|uniref:Uncharacterized protein n=1 Tax=Tulasnella calospora MUT 4182 TaxID=1051891 RepID=A0A0C3Q1W7_9AGAM|nr:hypothetical protein M407DRAFT_34066 [Tulasnella calospora MUT 4182]